MIAVLDLGEKHISMLADALRNLNATFVVTSVETQIFKADKVIIAGYGEASYGVRQLHLLNLFSVVRMIKKPMLGIGLGMQLMVNHSTEGNVACLGFFDGATKKFEQNDNRHEGYDTIKLSASSRLLNGINTNDTFFFDHGYYVPVSDFTTSFGNNGVDFSASIEKNDKFGVQFHPEKSGDSGLKILTNFINI